MPRRHLESALLASALIENGLTSVFRFTRIRFQRTLYPPDYQPTQDLPSTKFPDCHIRYCGDPLYRKKGDCENTVARDPKCLDSSLFEEDYFGVHSLKFSPDGRQLLAGSANTSVRVIDVTDGRQQRLLRPSTWKLGLPVTCLCYIPNNLHRVLGCTPQGDIFCLDPNYEGFETIIMEKNQQTYCLDVSPDGMELATAGKDPTIRIYNIHSDRLSGFEAYTGDVKKVDNYQTESPCGFSQNNESGKNFPGGKPEQIVDRSTKPFMAARSYGYHHLPQRSYENSESGDNPPEQKSTVVVPQILGYHPAGPADNYTEGHSMRITALKYHPTQPRLLISASWDHFVKIWDTRVRNRPVNEIYGPFVCSPEGLDIDGNHILTASWRKRQALEIWDIRNLHAEDRTPVDKHLASGDVDNTLRKQAYMHPAESIEVVEMGGGQNGGGECGGGGGGGGGGSSSGSGAYLYAARLLPSRAIVCGGSGFREVRVVHRDTKLPILRIPVDSVVQTIDSALEGRFIAIGCASGSITIAGLA